MSSLSRRDTENVVPLLLGNLPSRAIPSEFTENHVLGGGHGKLDEILAENGHPRKLAACELPLVETVRSKGE